MPLGGEEKERMGGGRREDNGRKGEGWEEKVKEGEGQREGREGRE